MSKRIDPVNLLCEKCNATGVANVAHLTAQKGTLYLILPSDWCVNVTVTNILDNKDVETVKFMCPRCKRN